MMFLHLVPQFYSRGGGEGGYLEREFVRSLTEFSFQSHKIFKRGLERHGVSAIPKAATISGNVK